MSRSDRTRLQEMLAAAIEAIDLTGGRHAPELAADRMRFLAIVRLLEVVGEAAKTVSPDFKAANPDIPWREMADTRNRLIHGYYDVDPEIVTRIVERNLPGLVDLVRRLLDLD